KVQRRKKTPSKLNAMLTGLATRAGVSVGYAWVESAGIDSNDLLDHIQASNFSLGAKDTAGPRDARREAQIVNYKLTYGKQTFTGQVWLDIETNLPLKRLLSSDQKNG